MSGLALDVTIGITRFKFEEICLGTLRFFPHANIIKSISYSPPPFDTTCLTSEAYTQYFKCLAEWGFIAQTFPAHIQLKAEQTNVTAWFATITMLRYLDECPWLISYWWKKVYHQKAVGDPWTALMALHRKYYFQQRAVNHNHALVNYNFSKVVDPLETLISLRQTITGFDFSKLQKLHTTFGGTDPLAYDPSGWGTPIEMTDELFLSSYEKALALRETKVRTAAILAA